ncbi:uncharacterized protein LOC132615249 [Lycium barbarum]|uniref:uncharacterized protein LOC132615249 n=1 Tax=Lycium barbarum TaxID=112863 RepID=UPI00293EFBE8|nr:uncharacterized protein LOC132615249 [Lycium barbarum]
MTLSRRTSQISRLLSSKQEEYEEDEDIQEDEEGEDIQEDEEDEDIQEDEEDEDIESRPSNPKLQHRSEFPVPFDLRTRGEGGGGGLSMEVERGRQSKLTPHQILYLAALENNWGLAKPILDKDPSLATAKITERGERVLHIAVSARSTQFVRELVKLMKEDDLKLESADGTTAFCFAAVSGVTDIAKAMIEINENLPNIPDNDGTTPITFAASLGKKDMVSYLYEVTNLEQLEKKELFQLLEVTIQNEIYDVALKILRRVKKIPVGRLSNLLNVLSKKPLTISSENPEGKWGQFIHLLNSGFQRACLLLTRMFMIVPFIPWFKRIGVLQEKSSQREQAGVLLKKLWAKCERQLSEDKLSKLVEDKEILHTATRAGNVEFLAVLIRNHPDLIWKVDKKMRTIFHVAVLHREGKVFSLIRQIGTIKDLIILIEDVDDNNILHLAGMLGQPSDLKQELEQQQLEEEPTEEPLQELIREIKQIKSTVCFKESNKIMPPSLLKVSGAALRMQREIMWFKEVEKTVPSSFLKNKNKDGKTPGQLFSEEHKHLLKEGEAWMKDTANYCMIVAALIATVMFAAAFTVPGGNNSDEGTPVMLKSNAFAVFVTSDAVALFSSIISIIMFLSILTSRYTEDDFLVALPAKILCGLTALFISIVSMLVAFAATFFLVYNYHRAYEPKVIAAFTGLPVALFAGLQFSLWLDTAKSTCSSKFLFTPGKHRIYNKQICHNRGAGYSFSLFNK